ncbi:MAG: LCP family protein [Clostridia bacterium]|nr:LCP family protein [Clostridia bacterium]
MSENNFEQNGIENNPAPVKKRGRNRALKPKSKFVRFFTRNHNRNLKAAIAIVACFVVLFFISAMLYGNRILDSINTGNFYKGNVDATLVDVVDEDISYRSMYDITDASSLNELLKNWATNDGEKMYSKNVINILLIGEDTNEETHRSDSMMLVSLNKKTRKIMLTSFLRDSYTYMDISGVERYDKINHSYAWGGAETLIETIENDYKIKIDNFVTIDFKAFTKAINIVGGVDVAITEKEAEYMNRTTHFNDYTSGSSVHLDGDHALIFSRIRYLDGESERTDRQKLVVRSLISKAKTLSLAEINELCDKVLPLVSTDLSKTDIINLATQAITFGWLGYPVSSQTKPDEDLREGVTMTTSSYRGLFVWVIDYPVAARRLQESIYGSSNIEIDEATHKSAIDMIHENASRDSYEYNEYGDEEDYYDSRYYNYNYNYRYGYEEDTTERWTFRWNLTTTKGYDDGDSGGIISSITDNLPSITLPSSGNDEDEEY